MINLSYKDIQKLRAIRYGLVGVAAIFAVAFLKVYLGSYTLNQSIQEAKLQKQQKLEEMAFEKNYYLRYLQSPYYTFFLKHETKILDENERIVELVFIEPKEEKGKNYAQSMISPPKAWKIFWTNLLKQNKWI